MNFFRRGRGGDSRNTFVGLMLVVALLFFLPRYFPGLIAEVLPQLYEAAPCDRLRTAEDRANHQSLIGRSGDNPISLAVRTSALPTDGAGFLYITITVTNNTVGTVGFVFNANAVIVGDNNTSGLGIVFNPSNGLTSGFTRAGDPAVIPEQSIRLLQPRQSCLYTLEFPAGNLFGIGTIQNGGTEVTAYYRNNVSGAITTSPVPQATPIFNDQGLWRGIVQSAPVRIPAAGQ